MHLKKDIAGHTITTTLQPKPPQDIDISFDKYKLIFAKEWNKLSSAGYIKKFQPIYDNKGWVDYITKEITTTNTDVIDEVTTHLN